MPFSLIKSTIFRFKTSLYHCYYGQTIQKYVKKDNYATQFSYFLYTCDEAVLRPLLFQINF